MADAQDHEQIIKAKGRHHAQQPQSVQLQTEEQPDLSQLDNDSGSEQNAVDSNHDAHRSGSEDVLSNFFAEPYIIGRVSAVDTQTIVVRLSSEELMSRVMVGNLAAVKSQLNGQCLIGVVTKIMSAGASDPDEALNTPLDGQVQASGGIGSAAPARSSDGAVNKNLISSSASAGTSSLLFAGAYAKYSAAFDSASTSSGTVNGCNTMVLQLIGTYYSRWGQRSHIFRRSLYAVPSLNAECALLYGGNLRCFMSALSAGSRLENDLPLEVGVYTMDSSTRISLNGNKFLQRHALIAGSTGSGKSWCVASLLEKAAQCRGTNIVLFDLHGEYKTLKGAAFRHFHVAGPEEKARKSSSSQALTSGVPAEAALAPDTKAELNADVGSTPLYLPYWFFNYEDLIAWFIGRSDNNAPLITQVFSREVLKCKQQSAVNSGLTALAAAADKLTSNTPVPYKLDAVLKALDDLDHELVNSQNTSRQKQGPYYGKLTRTINRIKNRREDKRCAFMFLEDSAEENDFGYLLKFCRALLTPAHSAAGSSTELSSEASSLRGAEPSAFASASEETSSSGSSAPDADAPQGGIKIIDLSEVPAELLPMVVSQIARLIFDVQFWTDSAERFPIALFCDEAHLYIPDERSGASERPAFIFERIAKEGRKYGISLVAISQRPSELNRTIISQCSNFVVMHLTNLKDKEVVQNMMPESMAYLVRQLPILEPGEAVFVGDACLLPSRVKLDVPQHKPDSATVDIWSVWSQGCPRDQAKVIDRSVLSLCRQSRFKL
ncbi:MAG: DUF87 domain-containing protein [Proteobacteria bacterium]|uniref:DUF87 domain-containing protein n=1 Tax=Candidatus Avisuccinivibrio stercorigallinarum TaxID=2840704 RepID=A0A9D9GST9_9GAMM|nr:DUF87 domain-containing protein [Candidatus Avisuccinivibrio stercorigallinarum]